MYNVFFFVNETATTEIYTSRHTLSLHDALPIYLDDRGAATLRVAATGDMLVGNGEVHPVSVTAGADGRLAFATDSGAPFTTATGSLAGDRKSTRLNSSH